MRTQKIKYLNSNFFVSEGVHRLLAEYTAANQEGKRDPNTLLNSHGVVATPFIKYKDAATIIWTALKEFISFRAWKIPANEREDFVHDALCTFFSKSNGRYAYNYSHSDQSNIYNNRIGFMNIFVASQIYEVYHKIGYKETIVDHGEKITVYKPYFKFVSLNNSEDTKYESLLEEINELLGRLQDTSDIAEHVNSVNDMRGILIESLKRIFSSLSGSPDKNVLGVYKIIIQHLVKTCNGGIADFETHGKITYGALHYVNNHTIFEITNNFASDVAQISNGEIILSENETNYIFEEFSIRLDRIDPKSGIRVGITYNKLRKFSFAPVRSQ